MIGAGHMKTIKNIIISMRAEQWTKNLIVFAGLFFGKSLDVFPRFVFVLQVFAIFCLVSSGSYILNDIIDRKDDAHHPGKSRRPIASGALGIPAAVMAMSALVFAGLLWAFSISPRLFTVVLAFLALHILYDFFLKHEAIVDVFAIALAFILRLLGGAVNSPVENMMSPWILLCTFLLALFLAMCKRRAEIAMLMEKSHYHRKSLADYSIEFLDQMITIAGGGTILCYSLYALSPETVVKHGTANLIYTIPFVAYGIFRYLYLVHIKKGGANPERLLLTDAPLIIDLFLYCVTVYLIIYRARI
jgi:4-hydroxybenzoate polyprenyltransferase